MPARKRAFQWIASLTRFGVVGAGAAAVHLATAVGLVQAMRLSPLVANLCAFTIAFVLSFFGHYLWTFADCRVPRRAAMMRFLVVAAAGFALNNAVLVWLLRSARAEPLAALVVAVLVIPLASYIGARAWAFRP